MFKSIALTGLIALSITLLHSPSVAQDQGFKKENHSYNEWTKGKFSEVVSVTNPGKFIFLAGIEAGR